MELTPSIPPATPKRPQPTGQTGGIPKITPDQLTGAGTTLTGDVTGSGVGSFATTIASNVVGNTKLRDSAALSVIGRSANSAGDPADIAAGSDGDILRRSGTTLGFGTILAASVSDLVEAAQDAVGSFVGNGLDYDDTTGAISVDETELNHNTLANLTVGDVHTQYALLAGRSGGQTLIGGTASGNDLTLQSTSNATKGNIFFGTSTYDEVNNRLGIGTQVPSSEAEIVGTLKITQNSGVGLSGLLDSTSLLELSRDGFATFAVSAHAAAGGDPSFLMLRSHGTRQSPTIIGINRFLGSFFARGYDGSSYLNAAGLRFAVDNTPGSGNMPGRITFHTSSDGSSDFAERMRINSSGNVGIGATSFGTSAAKVLGIANGTEPSTSPADMIQIFSTDISAGNASLGLRTETAVVAAAAGASDAYLNIKVNGTTYKLLLHT